VADGDGVAFLYDDTPDQRQAAEDVKRDMESRRPMDRLLCGDVGYGKTEVAIRAAFKAAQDGKQVAVLAPTTILVEQHRHTFAERLADYPVRVGALSRFRTPKRGAKLLAALAEGGSTSSSARTDSCRRTLSSRTSACSIVDEEQRFGVKHKERLKQMRAHVDVLSLTATPIPRTLYLSLSGIRDLSLIRTPPRDRMPIFTNVLPWSDQLLADALHRELDRGGQTFFLHNRLDTIYTVAEEVRGLVPEARVEVAHGQMNVHELDEVMRAFVDGEIDVLVCSSIIENGLDVPNANTLIVDRADRFGLAQLYQIRGRVGRSDRRAYCYLLVPEDVSEDAERRLRVLEHYTELGSGYSVALRDLELRGAGNLLGADQSGFAQQIGLDAYMRLLRKTVDRIQRGEEAVDWPDPEVSLAGAAYLPDEYVPDSSQKLHLYRRLSKASGLAEIESLKIELTDRFGQPPVEVERLLDAAALRVLGRSVGAERIFVRGRTARVTFRRDVVPRLAVLEAPLRQRRARIDVLRVQPLSVGLEQEGSEPIAETLTVALACAALREVRSRLNLEESMSMMKTRFAALAVTAVTVAFGACTDDATDPNLVARAGDYRLTVDDVVELLQDEESLPPQASVVESLAELWIDYTLLADAVADDTTFSESRLPRVRPAGGRAEMIFQLRDSVIQVDTFITPEELQDLYTAQAPEVELRARHIMMTLPFESTVAQRDSVRATLQGLRDRIVAGARFEDLARQFSQDPGSAQAGGDLGFFARGDLVQPFEDAVLALEPGELSQVVETPMGLHLIRLEERRVQDFEEIAPAFRARVQAQRTAAAESTFVPGSRDGRPPARRGRALRDPRARQESRHATLSGAPRGVPWSRGRAEPTK
jgi:hypothetical protein